MSSKAARTRMRKRQRQIAGLFPALGRWIGGRLLWMWEHPQPVLVAILVGTIVWALSDYTQKADAFRVTSIDIPAQTNLKFRQNIIVGRNIWNVDLLALAHELKQQQPWLKDVRVIRRLPNTIAVDVLPRYPIAQVKVDKWYPIDASGVFLPQPAEEASLDLPRLIGVQPKKDTIKNGTASDDQNLQLALRVTQTVRRSPMLKSRKLAAVDVSDPSGIRLILDDETEVRCGSEVELQAHLERLHQALNVVEEQHLAVKYIDVRFQDPVVAPRT